MEPIYLKSIFFTSYIKSITLFSYANLTLYIDIYSCKVATYENINGSIVNLCCLSSTCVCLREGVYLV